MATRRKFSRTEEVRKVFGYYSDDADELYARIRWVEVDLLNYSDVLDIMNNVDRVYHCAAMVSFEWK